jgi:hypothetical protein
MTRLIHLELAALAFTGLATGYGAGKWLVFEGRGYSVK